ncbi:MAG: hypothetical protein ABDK94_07205 [Atribacterota bacterium]
MLQEDASKSSTHALHAIALDDDPRIFCEPQSYPSVFPWKRELTLLG